MAENKRYKTNINLYELKNEYLLEPPRGFFQTLKYLGPGLILAAALVGSGELIATTTLGAQVGFYALWIVLVSCLIKVVVQVELGRYTISSGNTTMRAFNLVPGPHPGMSWLLLGYLIRYPFWVIMGGGLIGGVGQCLNIVFPFFGIKVWMVITALSCIALLFSGGYRMLQKFSAIMVVIFTIVTVTSVILVQWTPYAFSFNDIFNGLKLKLPSGGAFAALAVFGITGLSAGELIVYPYWCIEKGYARYTGPHEDSDDWKRRALGWVRVMQLDAVISMVIYTITTVAFYILGASILHGSEQIPKGMEMVQTLSLMFTRTFGSWSFYFFLFGSFFVLFSTFVLRTAGESRVFSDWLSVAGFVDGSIYEKRLFWGKIFILTVIPVSFAIFLLFGKPVLLVLIAGAMEAILLPVIAFFTVYMRYWGTDSSIAPSKITDSLLWICSFLFLIVAVYTVYMKIIS